MRSLTCLVVLALVGLSSVYGQTGSSITGKVTYEGPPVEMKPLKVDTDFGVCAQQEIMDESILVDAASKGLKNVVVFLEGVEAAPDWQPESRPVMDQVGCVFTPHVVILPLGQSLMVRNSDGILHNFHTYSDLNRSVNLAMPKTMTEMEVEGRRFRRPDFVSTKCDIHGWMSGFIVVAEHPYYTVTNDQGEFELKDVPSGRYNLVIWHEALEGKSQSVSITVGDSQQIDFALSEAKSE